MVAGDYHYVIDTYASPDGLRRVPFGVACRRSLAEYLESAEIFEITSQGLDFYAELFDQPYPFAKYDQVFVPEYNSGAMENVGCVTYNEAYLFRDPATENQRLDRGRDVPARARAHVVRQPGDDALVGRPVAQRELRHVHLATSR